MMTLKAEKRDMSVKAKKLRRQGMVVGNLYGREMKEAVPIQMTVLDAERFLKSNAKGSQAILDLDGQKINVLLKNEEYLPLKHEYQNVDFQALVEGEVVVATAPIILLNAEKVVGFLHHTLNEVTYKAVPSALIEKIEIDLAGMKAETNVFVGDLDIAKNKDIELVTPADSLILHIAEHQKGVMEGEEEETAATAEA